MREKIANGGKNPDVRKDQTYFGTPKTGKLYGTKILDKEELPAIKGFSAVTNGQVVDYFEAGGSTLDKSELKKRNF